MKPALPKLPELSVDMRRWGFQAGMPMVGYIVGWSLVAAAFVNVRTGFVYPRSLFGCSSVKVVCE